MPYMTPFEQDAIEHGARQGAIQTGQEILQEILQAKYGSIPENIAGAIAAIREPARLRTLNRLAATARSLDEFRAALEH